jgi:hypothetical protein
MNGAAAKQRSFATRVQSPRERYGQFSARLRSTWTTFSAHDGLRLRLPLQKLPILVGSALRLPPPSSQSPQPLVSRVAKTEAVNSPPYLLESLVQRRNRSLTIQKLLPPCAHYVAMINRAVVTARADMGKSLSEESDLNGRPPTLLAQNSARIATHRFAQATAATQLAHADESQNERVLQ